MRFSLIALTVVGIAATGFYAMNRPPVADLGLTTNSVAPEPGPAPEAARVEEAPAEKAERMVTQLLRPNKEDQPAPKPNPPPMVIAQGSDGAPQSAPSSAPPPSTSPPSNAADQPPKVDESALRYFAARGDTARLEAEISRLRALYPNWTPPADPLAAPVTTDGQLENMWQLYAQARYADVRKAIADRRAAEPGWQPPADLLDRLKLAEARVNLVAASDAKKYDEVIRLAAENANLLTCSEVEVLWRVADAFARTERQGRARDAYTYILDNCENPSERFATIQKAAEVLPHAMLEDLLAKERTPTGGQPEFEPLRDDIARRLVGEGNADPELVVPEAYLTRLERLAEAEESLPSDSLLLGWYYYRRDDLGAAERWFRRALTKEETASAAEGLALTLIAQKSPVEAESVLYRWRDSSPGAKDAYLAAVANLLALDPPPVLQQDVLQRMATVVISARNVDATQQFGWYARGMQQLETAAEWFQTALSWKSDDEPSAYGLVLTRNDLGDKAAVRRIQEEWEGRSERIARLGEQAERDTGQRRPADEAAREARPRAPESEAEAAGQPARRQQTRDVTVAASSVRRMTRVETATRPGKCWQTQDPRQLSPEAALSRGWCLMEINRPLEAAKAFDVAYGSSSVQVQSDAAYGKSLAYLRAGLTAKASVAAADAPQSNERAVELQSSILADRALNAFKLGRYRETLLVLDQRAQIAPEQTDLMALRGYAHMNLGRLGDARRIFQALADVGDKAGLRGLADVDAMD